MHSFLLSSDLYLGRLSSVYIKIDRCVYNFIFVVLAPLMSLQSSLVVVHGCLYLPCCRHRVVTQQLTGIFSMQEGPNYIQLIERALLPAGDKYWYKYLRTSEAKVQWLE